MARRAAEVARPEPMHPCDDNFTHKGIVNHTSADALNIYMGNLAYGTGRDAALTQATCD